MRLVRGFGAEGKDVMHSSRERLRLSYLVPVRWTAEEDARRGELSDYLKEIARLCDEVIVVDGSPPGTFEKNHDAWNGWTTHLHPDWDLGIMPMGKVAGVITGLRNARNEAVIIADDDVRYDQDGLWRVAELLRRHDLVRPQNYFSPLPWHARWDTARTLLNRALGSDYPGTLGVLKSSMRILRGYDGEVLFENLELIRTVEAGGGSTVSALGLYVRRLPPTAGGFFEQRIRHAYEDFAMPWRMALWLVVPPAAALMILTGRKRLVLRWAIGTIGAAEVGRRRAGGSQIFPVSSTLLSPAWVLERGVSAWIALTHRVWCGGMTYRDETITSAASSKRLLREHFLPLGEKRPPSRGERRKRRGPQEPGLD